MFKKRFLFEEGKRSACFKRPPSHYCQNVENIIIQQMFECLTQSIFYKLQINWDITSAHTKHENIRFKKLHYSLFVAYKNICKHLNKL